jgi:hypothetical protein
MASIRRDRRRSLRLGIVLFAIAATMTLGVTLTLAAPPFTTTVAVNNVDDLAVTISGVADSPSKADHHIVVEWGDGDVDVLPNFTTDAPWNWGPVSHTYAAGGSYTIVATLIHATPQGNDRGSASTSATVSAPTTTQDPGDEPAVLGKKVTKKTGKLAKTGPENIALATAGLTFLLTGVALRMIGRREETVPTAN